MQPNIENLRKWVEALESGEYKQFHGDWGQMTSEQTTINPGVFCCLNVASVVLTGHDVGAYPTLMAARRDIAMRLGLDDPNHGMRDSLQLFINLNDLDRLEFPEIAKHVRKEYLEVENARQ